MKERNLVFRGKERREITSLHISKPRETKFRYHLLREVQLTACAKITIRQTQPRAYIKVRLPEHLLKVKGGTSPQLSVINTGQSNTNTWKTSKLSQLYLNGYNKHN